MTKEDLAGALASRNRLTKSQSIHAIEGLMEEVSNALQRGENIYLRGFGTFKMVVRAEKKARIISKGATVTVPAHRTVKFIPCKELKENIRKQQ